MSLAHSRWGWGQPPPRKLLCLLSGKASKRASSHIHSGSSFWPCHAWRLYGENGLGGVCVQQCVQNCVEMGRMGNKGYRCVCVVTVGWLHSGGRERPLGSAEEAESKSVPQIRPWPPAGGLLAWPDPPCSVLWEIRIGSDYLAKHLWGGGGEASGISPPESKECQRSLENNGEPTALRWPRDVGLEGGSQLPARTQGRGQGLAGIQRSHGILEGGSRKQLGMTLIGISCLRMPSRFLHCRCSCKSKDVASLWPQMPVLEVGSCRIPLQPPSLSLRRAGSSLNPQQGAP